MGGELIARGIVEADQTWRMFAPYELVWAGGRIGRALAQGIYWGSRPIERVEQGLARYRERARTRRQRRLAARNGLSTPAEPVISAPPTGEPPAGMPERRKFRGKRRKEVPPAAAPE
jgi:2Fe-2S ferredoxin